MNKITEYSVFSPNENSKFSIDNINKFAEKFWEKFKKDLVGVLKIFEKP